VGVRINKHRLFEPGPHRHIFEEAAKHRPSLLAN
jgi:hypothetical protein